jgi:regulator of replication initiation timing
MVAGIIVLRLNSSVAVLQSQVSSLKQQNQYLYQEVVTLANQVQQMGAILEDTVEQKTAEDSIVEDTFKNIDNDHLISNEADNQEQISNGTVGTGKDLAEVE